jgi:ribosomal protein S18 acetylase RimI-like enzyme
VSTANRNDVASLIVRRADQLTSQEREDLARLLVACVDEGASLGFLAPLAMETARRWWARFPRKGVLLFVAEQDGLIVGTVQLHDAESANGAHRGEVAKLLVHPERRRQGIARALMRHLEAEARAAGKTLLFLDTREGDASNDVYRSLDYHEGGRIPDWAVDSTGIARATVFWYKAFVTSIQPAGLSG